MPDCAGGDAGARHVSKCPKRRDRPTLSLHQAGAPQDSDTVEQAQKEAILQQENSLFCRTESGSEVVGPFMSPMHTCELNGA